MRTQLPRPAPAAAPPCRAPPAAPPCGTRTATRRAAPRWRASLHARAAARCAAGSAAAEAAVEQPAAQQPDTLTLAVMGDLHMDPRNMGSFISARSQLVAALSDGEGRPLPAARVVQLGDLGAYATQPGSVACFDHAAGFLRCDGRRGRTRQGELARARCSVSACGDASSLVAPSHAHLASFPSEASRRSRSPLS